MRPYCPALTVVCCLLVATAGCVRTPTAAQREASFRPFITDAGEETDLRSFVGPRVVALFSGPGVGWMRTGDGRRALAVYGPYASGTGAVLTADGYVLTAAHCLVSEPVFAMFHAGERRGATEARVVWRGDGASAHPSLDLAIVKIDCTEPLLPLEWTDDDELARGVPVAAAGYHEWDDREVVMFAGGQVVYPRLRYRGGKKVRDGGGGTTPAVTTIGHDTPLTYGDSGGPLVTRAGRLAGINVGWEWPLLRKNRRIALRPDRAWVERTIAADRERAAASGTTRPVAIRE